MSDNSGKNKRPAFQFYCGDFLSDYHVVCMSMSQRGIYITLLAHSWLEEGLPTTEKKLSMLCGNPDTWEEDWPVVKECFVLDDDRYKNKRLERERERQNILSEKRREYGRKGGLTKSKSKAKAKQKLSTSIEVEAEVGSKKLKLSELEEEFENIFWIMWRNTKRTENKKRAMDSFIKARKSGYELDNIMTGLGGAIKNWAKTGKETQYIPHASTWLNGICWEDEIPSIGAVDKIESKREYIYKCDNCKSELKVNGELKGSEFTCDCGGLLMDKWTWEYEQNRKNPKPQPEPENISDEQKEFVQTLEILTEKMSA